MTSPLVATTLGLIERGLVPDRFTRSGIRHLVRSGLRQRERISPEQRTTEFQKLRAELCAGPIALHTDAANEQHYEVPAEFFALVLGKHRKYSGCYWPAGVESLDQAEAASLEVTCQHAELTDGQDVLELGCGWGSLTLWMAEHYPNSHITSVSNSHSQRRFIESQCQQRGLGNVRVITADMNDFATDDQFDRVVSVEMFEHMRNHDALMQRIAGWLRPEGKLFVHIFVHGRSTYLFETNGPANWMGRYFFTGGIMPADDLLPSYQRDLRLEQQWRQDGRHYELTANAWLQNTDRHRDEILDILGKVYGQNEKQRWLHRWRIFFMACAEMFGYADGQEWWVSHYLFHKP
jgi:cyclopropane-fatty-acyl-phospholipid synthase